MEDLEFRVNGAPGGTCLDKSLVPELIGKAREILLALFRNMRTDRTPLSFLSAKYQKPFTKILDDLDTPLEEALSVENLTASGAIMNETGEVVVCCHGPTEDCTCTISIMGIPRQVSDKYIPTEWLETRGITADSAPNSNKNFLTRITC